MRGYNDSDTGDAFCDGALADCSRDPRSFEPLQDGCFAQPEGSEPQTIAIGDRPGVFFRESTQERQTSGACPERTPLTRFKSPGPDRIASVSDVQADRLVAGAHDHIGRVAGFLRQRFEVWPHAIQSPQWRACSQSEFERERPQDVAFGGGNLHQQTLLAKALEDAVRRGTSDPAFRCQVEQPRSTVAAGDDQSHQGGRAADALFTAI